MYLTILARGACMLYAVVWPLLFKASGVRIWFAQQVAAHDVSSFSDKDDRGYQKLDESFSRTTVPADGGSDAMELFCC
ncbi:hypothetical protein ACO0LB_02790 [Undibacterium sp. SXout7W]|uniref:hypothetical protein n=1 Tax=Undibacterium sp. SXout7W TaxID=3413049 RepID=UPI003BF1EDA8